MVLDVVVEAEIAVLGVDEIDRVAMHLVRIVGIDEAVLIERDQRDERAAEETRDEKVDGGGRIEERDAEHKAIPDDEALDRLRESGASCPFSQGS